MKRYIPYGRHSIDEDDINSVVKILKSDFITQGRTIDEFEEQLAGCAGAKYAVVFNSGTAALHGAYFTAGLTAGDEFITPPITFAATSNAGLYLGARPVFVDVEKDTGNIDLNKIEDAITSKTKLISPVHYSGNPVDMEKLYEIAYKHKLLIVEDAAHALGAEYKGEKTGNCRFSDMTILSFHPVKHITTGEGGAVLTNNEEFYKKLLMFRTHGITKNDFVNQADGDWYHEMQFLGYNYRLTDIQAALGISQLKKLDKFLRRRREIADIYNKEFLNNEFFDIIIPCNYASSAYHLYPILLKDKLKSRKKDLFKQLREEGLGVQVHYIPVYLHPYYKSLGYEKGLCPSAEDFYEREISIPMYPSMTDDDIIYTIKTLFEVFSG